MSAGDETPGKPATTEDFEDLFENAPCGYLSLEPSGRIFRANATFARWIGFDTDELEGQRFQDLLNMAGRIYYETHFAPMLRMQGFFNEVALDLVTRSGARFPVLVNAVERRNEQGEPRFIRVTVFNASDRRRYEKELIEARAAADAANAQLVDLNATLEQRIAAAVAGRMKAEEAQRQSQKMEAVGQLTGGIAHDFNNMLAVVISALSLMKRRLAKGDTDIGQLAEAAEDGARRAASLTRRLLAFSRLQPLSPEPLDANRMVTSMSDLLHHTIGERVEIETILAAGLWRTKVDPSQLENAIVNLAVNARDAMEGSGKITIETANTHLDDAYVATQLGVPAGQYVLVAVSDTGPGMTPDVLAKAFDPFFTTKPLGKGTGLGLSQVHGFVKQSGGHIKIYSEIGVGTAIKIYLPRSTDGAEAQPRSQDLRAVAPVEAGATILVVEDDEHVRIVTVASLRELGYAVLSASRPSKALAILGGSERIDLMLSDVVMPEMDGRKLADAALKLRPQLRVLFTTGYTKNAIVHNGQLDLGTNLLMKPFSVEQLEAKVASVLRGHV